MGKFLMSHCQKAQIDGIDNACEFNDWDLMSKSETQSMFSRSSCLL